MVARHILVVDDDPSMRSMIAEYLSDRGFRISAVGTGRQMTELLAASTIDLLILDIKLADEDGLELLRSIRARSDLPVMVLSGHRREDVDRIVGLELGADDYLTKPVNLRELLARVQAVLRRSGGQPPPAEVHPARERYRFAGWQIDMRARRLSAPGGEDVPLTRGEFNLLAALVRSPQRVLTREQLLDAIHLHAEDVFDRSIDVQMLRLRRKLEANPSHPELLRTERGVGYFLAVPVERIDRPPLGPNPGS